MTDSIQTRRLEIRPYHLADRNTVVDYHFHTAEEDVLESGYFEGNQSSANVLSKLGFVETGSEPNFCHSRNRDLPHVDVELTRRAWVDRQ